MHEPYRVKVVESLPRVSPASRRAALAAAGYNTFALDAGAVEIDLISDSGTGAMSAAQWSAMSAAREDFSGQQAHANFVAAARSLFGFEHIQPVHQGRAAENLLLPLLLRRGDVALGNTFFETTRANIEALGAEARDLPEASEPWFGNIDLDRLERTLRRNRRVRLVVMTVTNNIMGGQPVSLDNLAAARALADEHHVLLALDASRFAGNAAMIKRLTTSRKPVRRLCREAFGHAHLAFLSLKKDGLANVGGVIAFSDHGLLEPLAHEIIRAESYPSAGGLAARDLAAMAIGLTEAVDDRTVFDHVDKVAFLGDELSRCGADVIRPTGAHGVAIRPPDGIEHAAHALAAGIYLEGGVRAGVFNGQVRFAVPRRVFTRDHLSQAAEVVGRACARDLPALECVHAPAEFFSFFARFELAGSDGR
ncbi:MAG: tryptophanase [Thermoanaerobaculales bacterium]|nr:tryptophanase [Thermoanaerobaculales bacterium]